MEFECFVQFPYMTLKYWNNRDTYVTLMQNIPK